MSVILMPYDKVVTKTILENLKKDSLEVISVTRNYSDVLKNAEEIKVLNYDYGIAMRIEEDSLSNDLHIICSGKNSIPEKAKEFINRLIAKNSNVSISKTTFMFKDNYFQAQLQQKTEYKTSYSSWYAEISAGESIDKPVFIIVIGKNNLDKKEEIEKELYFIINGEEQPKKKNFEPVQLQTKQPIVQEEKAVGEIQIEEKEKIVIEEKNNTDNEKKESISDFSLNWK